jgi:hypothetical protein
VEVKLLGPVHAYVAPDIVPAVKLKVEPTQMGVLLPPVGAEGVERIVTEVVPAVPVHPKIVAVTEYVPDAAVVAAPMLGFCEVEVKLFGPVHEYEAPEIVLAVSDKVFPEQIGMLLPPTGAAGIRFTVTEVVPAGPTQPATVAVTEYVPDVAVVAAPIVGFCEMELKLFGPVHE